MTTSFSPSCRRKQCCDQVDVMSEGQNPRVGASDTAMWARSCVFRLPRFSKLMCSLHECEPFCSLQACFNRCPGVMSEFDVFVSSTGFFNVNILDHLKRWKHSPFDGNTREFGNEMDLTWHHASLPGLNPTSTSFHKGPIVSCTHAVRLTSKERRAWMWKQHHRLKTTRSRGVGTPRVTGPLDTSLRALWVSGILSPGNGGTQEPTK